MTSGTAGVAAVSASSAESEVRVGVSEGMQDTVAPMGCGALIADSPGQGPAAEPTVGRATPGGVDVRMGSGVARGDRDAGVADSLGMNGERPGGAEAAIVGPVLETRMTLGAPSCQTAQHTPEATLSVTVTTPATTASPELAVRPRDAATRASAFP